MAIIQPFKAIRPTRDKVHLVASRAVHSYSRRILNAKLETNPYTFIHIIQPEFGQKNKSRPNSDERFKRVYQKFNTFRNNGWLLQDEQPCYYLYRQTKENGKVYTGLIAGASTDDYLNGTIKKHEQTLTKRENIFTRYLDICTFNAEPVLLTYPDHDELEKTFGRYLAQRPEYDFTNTDHIRHQLWNINRKEDLDLITRAFEDFRSIYIADGHHRTASSALLAQQRRSKNRNFTGKEPFNFFMSLFIPESQLDIYDYNRVIKDLNGLDKATFLQKLETTFKVQKEGNALPEKPTRIHEMLMYLEDDWYRLHYRPGTINDNNAVASLDSHLLTQYLLAPILNIHDLKTDKRIDFTGGPEGLEGILKRVDSKKFKVGFVLRPVELGQLKKIADEGLTMPPKSTWIEPKIRSGLTIFKL